MALRGWKRGGCRDRGLSGTLPRCWFQRRGGFQRYRGANRHHPADHRQKPEAKGENLPDVIRAFLKRYARTAPKPTEETQP
jgi:hypothetical protein